MLGRVRTSVSVAVLASVVLLATSCATTAPTGQSDPTSAGRHVLLISVDGLHQSDLDRYVTEYPGSALASLTHGGTSYTNASTPVPSDSFPGTVAEVTGGNPATTGVYYDSVYDRRVLPAGTTTCSNRALGGDVELTEAADRDDKALDAGQGLSGLPGGIFSMTGRPADVLDPAKLPVDPASCTPMLPHRFLRVNTVFEVARAHGLLTAWSDKHPAYEILNGPSGAGVADLFAPEIASQADGLPAGKDWTADNTRTQQYDGLKAQAVRNELDGFDHAHLGHVGVPAVLGMNFQTVSTAQKLPTSAGQAGGYLADGRTPGPVLARALAAVDAELGSFLREIDVQGLRAGTTIIVTAKHGQSPMNPAAVLRVDDGPIIDGMNTTWAAAHPGAPKLVVHSTDDDAMHLWLSDRSPAATDFARDYLLAQNGTGTDAAGAPRPFTASGLAQVLAGADATASFHAAPDDPRVPDVVGVAIHGVVFTGGKSKSAEHGGSDPEDRSVPVVVAGPGIPAGRADGAAVETAAIAPTVVRALGLDPQELEAVRAERTAPLG